MRFGFGIYNHIFLGPIEMATFTNLFFLFFSFLSFNKLNNNKKRSGDLNLKHLY